jgi:hypothetical protein
MPADSSLISLHHLSFSIIDLDQPGRPAALVHLAEPLTTLPLSLMVRAGRKFLQFLAAGPPTLRKPRYCGVAHSVASRNINQGFTCCSSR